MSSHPNHLNRLNDAFRQSNESVNVLEQSNLSNQQDNAFQQSNRLIEHSGQPNRLNRLNKALRKSNQSIDNSRQPNKFNRNNDRLIRSNQAINGKQPHQFGRPAHFVNKANQLFDPLLAGQYLPKLLNRLGNKMKTQKRKTSSSRDLRGSLDKKGGSTSRSASGLHASSTRVSTKRLITQLDSYSLCIKDVMIYGNCLFRSPSDQMIGESNEHLEYRNHVTINIFAHSEDFEPSFSEHDNFQKSVMALSKLGRFTRNEALVAYAQMYSIDIVIHQLNQYPWRIRANFNSDHVLAAPNSYHCTIGIASRCCS
ncbi:hypothetical protein GJ496_001075 [Pomphorhynchus laevis]|nr:hypothetical protein GJ496_001075 [Pomphorhynchus laevis]